MTEAEFQKQVIELAKLSGWRVAHFKTARMQSGSWATPTQGDAKGFPDLVLARERILFVELKAEKGRVRPEQEMWLNLLAAAGAETHLWRPSDLDIIAAVLKKVSRATALSSEQVLALLGGDL